MNDTVPDALIFLVAGSASDATRIAIASDGRIELHLPGTDIFFRPTKKMAEDFENRGLRARANKNLSNPDQPSS
jgi:hypothetical protein